MKNLKGSGRTTRMLEWAAGQDIKPRIIVNNPDTYRAKYSDLVFDAGWFNMYRASPNILIDHFVLEHRLQKVINYLSDCPTLYTAVKAAKVIQHLRAVYLIVDSDNLHEDRSLKGFFNMDHIKLETESSMRGFDYLNFVPEGKPHPSTVFLVDPDLLRSKFEWALSEIHRWD